MTAILGLHSTRSIRPLEDPRREENPVQKVTLHPGENSRLSFLTEPAGLAVERYRILRRRLCTLHPQGGVVLITSPNPGEGKTQTSVNLAWALADSRQDVCLVDLDFRAPGVSRTLQYSFEDGGVEEVLDGKQPLHQLLRQIGDHPLFVLGIKNRLISPGSLLSSQALADLIAKLRAKFKWVVLDFAPVIPMADVTEVIPHVDGVIMVVRARRTEKSMILPAIEMLESKLWGVVANDCPIDGSSYYGYYGVRKD